MENIKSNILYFDIDAGRTRNNELAGQTRNIKIYPFQISLGNVHFFESSPDHFRLVTHYGITSEDIKTVLEKLKYMVK